MPGIRDAEDRSVLASEEHDIMVKETEPIGLNSLSKNI